MRKSIVISIFLCLLLTSAGAQRFSPAADNHVIRVGFYMPGDAKAGTILGYQMGKTVDERVSFGFSADLYFKNYTKESDIDSTDTYSGQVITFQREVDFSTKMLPLMGNVIVNIPMDISGMSPYLGGGIGAALLLNREVNYLTDESDTRFFAAWTWNVTGGIEYELGGNSSLRAELFYNRALMKGSRDESKEGYPVYDQLNMSGIGLRLGLVMEM